MIIFLKRSHISNLYFLLPISLISTALLLRHPYRFHTSYLVPAVGIPITIALTLFCLQYTNKFGLYINGADITYKSFKERKIPTEKIAAIKITRAVLHQHIGGDNTLIDRGGKQLYTMIFLQESDLWKRENTDVSDDTFRSLYREHILCSCIYDQSAIDYLLTLNPNIIVF